ncbi:MAG: LPXTG cell wall anchor domain-containing protein [Bryobacteraceae bacterium]|jgi:LPXTG-motif cell wall-anchored protein
MEIDDYMKHFRSIAFAAFAGLIGVALLPSLQADTWNKKTNLTVNEPLQVPSCCTPGHTVTLQPGEYVMVLVDSLSDRHIVRIFDKDQQTVITTILAIPNYRLQPTGKTVFGYWEVPAGQPRALRAWFYPGDNFGQEFAYPKQTAAQIAAFVKTPVPAIAVETSAVEDLKTAPIVVVDESGKTTELAQTTPAPAPEPAAQPAVQEPAPQPAVQAAVQAEAAPVQPQTADRAVEPETPAPAKTLPHTASGLPLLGLAGLVSLAVFAALGFRSRRRRSCQA